MPFHIHLTKFAKKFMNEAKIKCAQKGIIFESKVIFGSPTVEIEEFSRKGKFDVIIIGSRGQSGLKEVFLGSVAKVIVHKSKVPVLVVK